MEHDFAALRREYADRGLAEQDVAADPLEQFHRWLADAVAAGLPEPNAMVLATVDPDGQPSARTVLLKGVDARGFVWFTNYRSRKGRDLEGNPRAALLFAWVGIERQVGVTGTVERVGPGGVGVVLRAAAARRPAGRLGQRAVRGDPVAGLAGGAGRRRGGAVPGGQSGADAAALGRAAAGAGVAGVLAGADQPAARPAAVPPGPGLGLGVDARPALTLRSGPGQQRPAGPAMGQESRRTNPAPAGRVTAWYWPTALRPVAPEPAASGQPPRSSDH